MSAQVLKNSDSSSSTKVQVYSNTDYFDDGPALQNIIKINPLLILSGEIPIYFERMITKKLTGEIGIGPTIKNYTNLIYQLAEETIDPSTQKAKPGITLKMALRYYPGNDGYPEGVYFSPEFRYKSYRLEQITEPGSTLTIDPQLSSRYTDFVLLVGSQTEWESNFYIDYYAGGGLRKKYEEFIDYDQDNLGNFVYFNKTLEATVPLLSLGFKVGFSF